MQLVRLISEFFNFDIDTQIMRLEFDFLRHVCVLIGVKQDNTSACSTRRAAYDPRKTSSRSQKKKKKKNAMTGEEPEQQHGRSSEERYFWKTSCCCLKMLFIIMWRNRSTGKGAVVTTHIATECWGGGCSRQLFYIIYKIIIFYIDAKIEFWA